MKEISNTCNSVLIFQCINWKIDAFLVVCQLWQLAVRIITSSIDSLVLVHITPTGMKTG